MGIALQVMTPAMISGVENLLERRKSYGGQEIEVFEEFRLLTSEVISRTAFGNGYNMLMSLVVNIQQCL